MQALLVLIFAAVATASLAPFYRVEPNIPGQYIVVLEDGVDVSRFAATIKTGSVRKTLTGIINAVVLTLDGDLDIVRGLNGVRYIEENGLATVLGDRNAGDYWGLDRIGQRDLPLDNKIDITGTGSGANVFIIDTGIQHNHEDFDGRASYFFDYEAENRGEDCHGHGTHCAGTVGGMYSGVATEVNLFSVRVMTCRGSGSYANIIEGLNAVANSGMENKVASMSIGGGYSAALNQAVESAISKDVAVVVAAGNDNADACNTSPASAGNAITVGATREGLSSSGDPRSSFSNYGTCVDIFAPGSSIRSAKLSKTGATNGYTSMSGTSMACPHVAGAAAILRGKDNLSPQQVAANLMNSATADTVSDPGSGSPNLLLYVE